MLLGQFHKNWWKLSALAHEFTISHTVGERSSIRMPLGMCVYMCRHADMHIHAALQQHPWSMLLKEEGSTWDSEVNITSGLGKQEFGWWVSKPCLQLYKNEDVLPNVMVSRATDRDSWTVRLSASFVKSSRVWDLLDITCNGLFRVGLLLRHPYSCIRNSSLFGLSTRNPQ